VAQAELAAEVLELAKIAPFVQPLTPGGRRMSVQMTSLGPLGWTTDERGYRYSPAHPLTGRPWPPIPGVLLALWDELTPAPAPPDSCLVNLYRGAARMGLHQDRDEADFGFPVLSVSLGDTAVFRIGGTRRGDSTVTVRLASGDVCALQGPARRAYHGVDRVIAGSSRLLAAGGRINLTLRRAAPRGTGFDGPCAPPGGGAIEPRRPGGRIDDQGETAQW
jgi:alkylated DNA repair protein (DNA oxidative demethylase)